MRLIVDLPEQLEHELSAEAERLGLSLPDYVLHILALQKSTQRSDTRMPKNGAELIGYWQREGLIGTRQAGVDSPELARSIRHQAERRLRE